MRSLVKLQVFLFGLAFAGGRKGAIAASMNKAPTHDSAVQAPVVAVRPQERGRTNNLAAKLSKTVARPVAGLSRYNNRPKI
ncbi:MAG: hypothetical protein V7661_05125 [Sulfitobacter sp.]